MPQQYRVFGSLHSILACVKICNFNNANALGQHWGSDLAVHSIHFHLHSDVKLMGIPAYTCSAGLWVVLGT
jgi:hypothetical protein